MKEGLDNIEPPAKSAEDTTNFHELAENRKDLRRAIDELGVTATSPIFEKHYKKEQAELDVKATTFKVVDFEGMTGAKRVLREQKRQYEEKIIAGRSQIDIETIEKQNPEMLPIRKAKGNIAELKDFRMRRMFEILNPNISLATKKRNEGVLVTVAEEINESEKVVARADVVVAHETVLVDYKENLSQSGHICITPSVENNLEAIGDRMLTGKPIFLHGPTGTGKTSLARFAATHFTGENPEMVFCNPQTKESNVWGKTGIRPAKGGTIETVEIYGPLSLAMSEGRTVIFDEFTALPKEQMVFIKGIFNAKIGDKINITGNGIVEIKPGFQMIFTANLKSEKNPERQELPPEIAREFEQNNVKIDYTPPEEAYDIMLARLLNRDGSLDMSYYDLNTTLPNLCRVMEEIQESYTNQTGQGVIDRAGLKGVGGRVHSLKKFVMTQGSVEAILSSWIVEKQTGKTGRSFSEYLDERFKTALTFEEYSKDDRILAAKILASRGFLTTLSAKEIGLPDDIFTLNTSKALHGENAVKELRNKSGNVRHLTLKEVAELDPFDVQAEEMRKRAETLLVGQEKGSDAFSKSMRARIEKLKREEGSKGKVVAVEYEHVDSTTGKIEHQETIAIDIEKKVQEFITFYKKTSVDLPPSFEQDVFDIWERNRDEIEKAIKENGFDNILLMSANLPLPDLAEKMKMGNGYYESSNFTSGGGFAGAVSQNVDKPRIILYHNTETLPEITKKTGLDAHLNITGADMEKLFQSNPSNYLSTLEDFVVLERKYFEDTGKHLSDWRKKSANWLPGTKSGARLVYSGWLPDSDRLNVRAYDLVLHHENLGARPSRSFY